MNLFEQISRIAAEDPHRPALYDSHRTLTYAALEHEIQQLSDQLKALKISRLALQIDNGIDWALVDLACMFSGIVVIPVPLFFSEEQQNWLLETSGADALVGPSKAGWLSSQLASLPLQRCQPAEVPSIPEGTAKITYTSGTTGHPKGVCLSFSHLMNVCQSIAERIRSADIRQHLTLLPLSTLLENITGLYVPLLTGASSCIPSLTEVGLTGSSQFSPPVFAQALKRWQPHSLVLVPELLRMLVAMCSADSSLASSLRFVAVGGGKVAADLIHKARQSGLPVYEGYGLSECGSAVALNSPDHDLPGAVGLPLRHCHVVISDDGEVLVNGAPMLGYLGDSSSHEQIATGDLGHIDEQGFLHITGRRKNVQITAFGRNFSPEWIEAEAQIYPSITRIVVFGDALPANIAIVQTTPGQEKQLPAHIAHLNTHLPDYARIHHYIEAELTAASGLITSNGRPKRQKILDIYQTQIAQIFAGDPI